MLTRGVGADLPARLALDDRKLHVLDLYPHLRRNGPLKTRAGEWRAGLVCAHQQEEDLAVHHVAQVVARLVVLELDVQAIFDAHLPGAEGAVRSLAFGRLACARSRTSILIGGLFSGASFTTCGGSLVGGRRHERSGAAGGRGSLA